MLGVEIVEDRGTKQDFAAEEKVGARVHQAMQQHGLFSRMRGDVVCVAPPVVITHEEMDRIIAAVAGGIGDVLGSS